MSQTVYEFPLNEKVRTYLRLEQLFSQLHDSAEVTEDWQAIRFLESLFTLCELLDRVDVRTDLLKDLDEQERILQHWASHPQIDSSALAETTTYTLALRDRLKRERKFGASVRDDKFLAGIKQRFSIPGATCSFDLPSLHYWLKQPASAKAENIQQWLSGYKLISDCLLTSLGFLRQRGQFHRIEAKGGYYQGVTDDKLSLVRVRCLIDQGYYPTLSGNKYRYAIRFMWFNPEQEGQSSVDSNVSFELSRC